MVQITQTALSLAAMLTVSTLPVNLADNVPSFHVPVFNYDTLSTGNTPYEVLNALKKDGIISFSNVPSYAQVRRTYLEMAAACAVSAQEANAEFLYQKTLTDGTKRYTISTTSGRAANFAAITTDATCPGYKEVYGQFSSLFEMVVLSVATALDATNFTTKDGYGQIVSSRKLMTDAVRLDHFHAYEPPSSRKLMSELSDINTNAVPDKNFTLEMHEDNGMFIMFSTPAFYKVSNGGLKHTFEPVSSSGEDGLGSGLLIRTRDGQLVQPILEPDYVTLMVGTGFNKWVDSSHDLPPVSHAMRIPEMQMMPTQRLIRAWFGKMTLLPSYQHMVGQMDFETHMNASAHYLRQGHESDRPLLGCAPGRHLAASKPRRRRGTMRNHVLDQQSCSGQKRVCNPSQPPLVPVPLPAPVAASVPAPVAASVPAPVLPTVPAPGPAPVLSPVPAPGPALVPEPALVPASVPASVLAPAFIPLSSFTPTWSSIDHSVPSPVSSLPSLVDATQLNETKRDVPMESPAVVSTHVKPSRHEMC
ncbi:unnamed protein product [Peronospora belbahrii]|uniref:Uncharacterized protein n=1 Tax=Peronospora belbahrii TaxID=622444 RepID=A0AAU9KQ60_9STRA|nr:unnamed protein product [Peronospora belbahrii]